MTDGSSLWDLVIIGAGIYGIQAARTYLELHPQKRVVVLEASASVGGVWSKERVYDGFWTQTPLGLLEFSDRALENVPDKEQYYGFFKAHHAAKYLERYCDDHTYNEASLRSRIYIHHAVTEVFKKDDLWHITTQNRSTYVAPRVIDASGLTSIPKYPQLYGLDDFKGTIIHHKDFAKWEHEHAKDTESKIVVIGGAKSAADVAYACAKRGHEVTWLIRRLGSGPAAFVSAKGRGGYANSNESFYTRLTSLFLVSLFALSSGYVAFLNFINNSRPGRYLLQRIWNGINDKAWKEADYDRADGRANGFYNLKPDTELFWQNDSTGFNQREDFFDVIARCVKVCREDVSHLCAGGIALDTGEMLQADTIVCATGWKMEHPYFDQRLAAELGLPVAGNALSSAQTAHWAEMDTAADQRIIQTFPILNGEWARSNAKRLTNTENASTPLRLWKSMVPVNDPSIIFVGRLMLGNHFRAAEVQALFACGILDGVVRLPSRDEMQVNVSETVAWCRRRYLKKGAIGNWFYWDMVPYTDMLLHEMGLDSHRHRPWWKDLLRPCYARDLVDLIDEYKKKLPR